MTENTTKQVLFPIRGRHQQSNSALSTPTVHFWDPWHACSSAIAKIGAACEAHPCCDRAHVVNAWDALLGIYFQESGATPGGGCHCIRLERRNGPIATDNKQKATRTLIVEHITNVQHRPGSRPTADSSDIFWVECAASDELANPSGWSDLMRRAVNRLDVEYPAHRLFVIVAIGLRWMPFLWDPVESVVDGGLTLLWRQSSCGDDGYKIDHRIQMASSAAVDGLTQRHVERLDQGLTVNPQQAYSLDYWTLDETGSVMNLDDLLFLEKLIVGVKVDSSK
ncbi:hypothetical protein MFIFM68171_07675 [Madurella fahalii]|uniref:Uncharacterized protein n=1 Tax=Madurella fahalii TaxID=1157608 RepID=A0ABQ0GI73_9PEZI